MCCAIGFVGFIGMVFVAGLVTLAHGLWSARQSMRAANWPTTPARITQLEIKVRCRTVTKPK
jgi:hypothetical protein